MRYLHTKDPRDIDEIIAANNPTPEEPDGPRVVKIEFYKEAGRPDSLWPELRHVVMACDCDMYTAYQMAVKNGASPLETIRYTFA